VQGAARVSRCGRCRRAAAEAGMRVSRRPSAITVLARPWRRMASAGPLHAEGDGHAQTILVAVPARIASDAVAVRVRATDRLLRGTGAGAARADARPGRPAHPPS